MAIVRTRKAGRPFLKQCAVHSAAELRPEQVFGPLAHNRELAGAPVSAVLAASDYQLAQVPAPAVPPAEMRSAIRWTLRDIINYPVSEAVIDVFEVPEQARHAETRTVFAVAARNDAVRRIVDVLKPRARGFSVIDIPELCLRNLAALLPQDERGVALLALGEDFAQLVVTCQGRLYLARRIALQSPDTLSLDGSAEPPLQGLVVELQRSINYYEIHYDRAPIADVFVTSGDARAEALLGPLRDQTGLETHLLDVRELFELEGHLEPDLRFTGLCALGAALRTDWGSS